MIVVQKQVNAPYTARIRHRSQFVTILELIAAPPDVLNKILAALEY